jgi:peptide/nickel transport system permease protein
MTTSVPSPRVRWPRAHARLKGPLHLLREIVARPSGAIGLAIIVALLLLVILGPWLTPYGSSEQDVPHRLEGPSADHLLGTDHLGRDLLSRLVIGTRIALGVAVPAVGLALIIGLLLGILAGYAGGWIDSTMLVVMDTLQAFPAVILALALLSLLGPSLRNVIIVIAFAFAPSYARVTRALVYQTKQQQFIEAHRSLGVSRVRLVRKHILPNIFQPLLVLMAMDIPSAIAIEAGLSFLGLGVQPPTPSWGLVLADGFSYVRDSSWAIIWASVALALATLGFTMLGETLRDVVDPRLAGSREFRRIRV